MLKLDPAATGEDVAYNHVPTPCTLTPMSFKSNAATRVVKSAGRYYKKLTAESMVNATTFCFNPAPCV